MALIFFFPANAFANKITETENNNIGAVPGNLQNTNSTPKEDTTNDFKIATPQTGDMIILFAILLMISVYGLSILLKIKKIYNNK